MGSGLGGRQALREGDRRRRLCDLCCSHVHRSHSIGRGLAHAVRAILIEGSEESGSPHLPATLDVIADRLGRPSLVVSLDSGCLSYDRIWCTGSVRGLVSGTLTVRVLEQGVHSGSAAGLVPSSFRIARMLLSRIENETTGEILLDELKVAIPSSVRRDSQTVAGMVGDEYFEEFPVVDGLEIAGTHTADRLVRRNWQPAMSVTGADGLPALVSAGNVLRPFTSLQLGFRLSPTCDSRLCAEAIERVLTADPPYGARVTFELQSAADGWAAPVREKWLDEAVDAASAECFGSSFGTVGEGGTIPFLGMFERSLPGGSGFGNRSARPGEQRPWAQRVPSRDDGNEGSPRRSVSCSMPTRGTSTTDRRRLFHRLADHPEYVCGSSTRAATMEPSESYRGNLAARR